MSMDNTCSYTYGYYMSMNPFSFSYSISLMLGQEHHDGNVALLGLFQSYSNV